MKVLLVGGGGREHALAWKLKQDDPQLELIVAPGNPGIAAIARCVRIASDDVNALVALARSEGVILTIVGPEAPLAAGIVDTFREHGLAIFGPTRAAAQIETSKRFAKEVMFAAGVPTAAATWHADADAAKAAARRLGAPHVIKASGLAAGKGVVVCETLEESDRVIDLMLRDRAFGDAGSEVLVEEFMEGEELSIFAVTDGENFRVMLPAQDHKRLLSGDRGPNTGGMGAYAPVRAATPDIMLHVAKKVFAPTLRALNESGTSFTGLLYAGLMLTARGPKVVEFNCRFGDPETQALLPLLASPLLPALVGASEPGGLAGAAEFEWKVASAVTTVVAAPGYPSSPRTGAPIVLPPSLEGVTMFHAGTSVDEAGTLRTSGGRILAVTAVAPTFADAQRQSAASAASIDFPDRQYRDDIGWRELKRLAGAS